MAQNHQLVSNEESVGRPRATTGIRRTLFAIGFAVLASMLLAPHGNKPGSLRGWGPFFSDYGLSAQDFAYRDIGRVMIDMLILQTVFLSVLFAVIVNIRWRPSRRVVIWFAVGVALLLMVCFGFAFQAMQKQAAIFRAEKDEELARQLLRMTNVFDQFDSHRADQAYSYPDDKKIAEAKRLLLEAAEKWHIAGNTAAEQRVRAWEKNVKTKAELLASLPDQPPNWALDEIILPAPKSSDQPPNKYVSTDPNAGLDLAQLEAEEKLIHKPIDYQHGTFQTSSGEAFVFAKFFERNLGDRKAELDVLAERLGAQKRYTLADKQKQGNVWLVCVFLYKR